jgi:hypothetical protein
VRSKLQALMDEKTVTVGKALRNLDSALARLDELLATDCSWVSVEGEANFSTAMAKVRAAYAEIEGDTGEHRAMPGCRGIVAATPRVIAAAHRVNAAKGELIVACNGLRGHTSVKRFNQEGRPTWVSIHRSRLLLTALGRPNLNLFAAYRKIPILTGIPQRVRFGSRYGYSVGSVTRETIADQLRRRHDADSLEDLRRVDQLPRRETTLALRDNSRLYPFAGVLFEGFNGQGRTSEDMSTFVPILYPAAGVAPTVLYAGPRSCPRTNRTGRKICPQQYLKTMRVHRYLRFMDEAELPGG